MAYYLSGLGNNQQLALDDAKRKYFDFVATGEKMPRPGSKPEVIFASNEQVSLFPELRDNFIKEVLQLEWALLSDESSLWDFHDDTDNSKMYLQIGTVYGVDVLHIASANIADVLKGIMSEIHTFPEDDILRAIRLGRDARARYIIGLPEHTWNAYY